jgi:uncharacterized protein (TIGR03067 family)
MRRTLLLLIGVLFSVMALASDSPKDYDDATQIDGLEGTWQAVSVENTGGSFRTPPQWCMIFHAGKYTWTGLGIAPKGSYKVDVSKKPARLDITCADLPAAEDTMKCIYRIDGDILKIAWDLGGERAQIFDIQCDRRQSVSIFKRVRK